MGTPASANTQGRALYLEFRRDGYTNQFIFTPEISDPVTKTVIPLGLLSRQISATNPRRQWRHRFSSVESTLDPSGRTFLHLAVTQAVEQAAQRVDVFLSYINSMHLGGWTLYRQPLAVEVSAMDVADFAAQNTPNALIRRVDRARAEANFDKSYWDAAPVAAAF